MVLALISLVVQIAFGIRSVLVSALESLSFRQAVAVIVAGAI